MKNVAAIAVLVLGMSCGLIAGDTRAQAPAPITTASLPPPGVEERRAARLPKILPARDAALYRKVFALQEEGRWKAADALIERIQDRLLMGHVRFQRLMHPTLYRSSYGELWNWMEAYADHPGARRVFRLAKRRQPEGWKSPRPPARAVLVSELKSDTEPVSWLARAGDGRRMARENGARAKTLSPEQQAIGRKVRAWVSRGRVTPAYRFLEEQGRHDRLDAVTFDENLVWIARGYFIFGKDREAFTVARRAVTRSGRRVPLAYWWGRAGGVAPGAARRCGLVVRHPGRVAVGDALAGVVRRLLGEPRLAGDRRTESCARHA